MEVTGNHDGAVARDALSFQCLDRGDAGNSVQPPRHGTDDPIGGVPANVAHAEHGPHVCRRLQRLEDIPPRLCAQHALDPAPHGGLRFIGTVSGEPERLAELLDGQIGGRAKEVAHLEGTVVGIAVRHMSQGAAPEAHGT